MKNRTVRNLDKLAASIGASGWTLVRANKHLLVDFHLPAGAFRQVMAASPSDRRAASNVRAQVRKCMRG